MRYIILVLLNTPIILAVLINIITQYKLKKISKNRLKHQLLIWLFALIIIIGSFPVYNLTMSKDLFDSSELSLFDIVEITTIVFLLSIANSQRQRIDQNEQRLRELHQALSIKLSK